MTLQTILTITGMALATYLTRVLGFLLLRKRHLSAGARHVLEIAPGCVMVSAIAPGFFSNGPARTLAMLIAIACARRFPMLVTLVISMASLALLQYILP